jgi:NADH-quinone oxidoreductase subunit H
LIKVLVLLTKSFAFIVVIQMLRWTIPRFRFDQLMGLAWKVLIPLATLNVVCVMIVKQYHLSLFWLLPMSIGLFLGAGLLGTQSSRPFARRTVGPAVETSGHHAHAH